MDLCACRESCLLPGHCRVLLALTGVCLGLSNPAYTVPGAQFRSRGQSAPVAVRPQPGWSPSSLQPGPVMTPPSPCWLLSWPSLRWSLRPSLAFLGLCLTLVHLTESDLTLSHSPVSCLASVHPWSHRGAWCPVPGLPIASYKIRVKI